MRTEKVFLYMNCILPILLGGVIYYLISPDVLFVQQIDTFVGRGIHLENIDRTLVVVRFLRNYLLDILWSYALYFAVVIILGRGTKNAVRALWIAGLFSVAMEVLQLTPMFPGTFDICDIIFEFLAEAAAYCISKKLYTGGEKYEK